MKRESGGVKKVAHMTRTELMLWVIFAGVLAPICDTITSSNKVGCLYKQGDVVKHKRTEESGPVYAVVVDPTTEACTYYAYVGELPDRELVAGPEKEFTKILNH